MTYFMPHHAQEDYDLLVKRLARNSSETGPVMQATPEQNQAFLDECAVLDAERIAEIAQNQPALSMTAFTSDLMSGQALALAATSRVLAS